MLLPDTIHPKDSIYYTGAIVLKILQPIGGIKIGDLYVELKKEYNLTFPVLLLTLDWLYLINAAIIDKKGEIVLCS